MISHPLLLTGRALTGRVLGGRALAGAPLPVKRWLSWPAKATTRDARGKRGGGSACGGGGGESALRRPASACEPRSGAGAGGTDSSSSHVKLAGSQPSTASAASSSAFIILTATGAPVSVPSAMIERAECTTEKAPFPICAPSKYDPADASSSARRNSGGPLHIASEFRSCETGPPRCGRGAEPALASMPVRCTAGPHSA